VNEIFCFSVSRKKNYFFFFFAAFFAGFFAAFFFAIRIASLQLFFKKEKRAYELTLISIAQK